MTNLEAAKLRLPVDYGSHIRRIRWLIVVLASVDHADADEVHHISSCSNSNLVVHDANTSNTALAALVVILKFWQQIGPVNGT